MVKERNKVGCLEPESRVKVSLKEDQLQRALSHLIALINTADSKQFYIPKEFIFKLIEDRYKLSKDESVSGKSFQEIVDESKNTKYYNPQFDRKFPVEIPYCKFFSFKECKMSIERIVNMPLKAAQRIAFRIYDRNGNGIIDEKDIFELLTVGEDFEAMREDMCVIVKNYKVASVSPLDTPRPKFKTSPPPKHEPLDASSFSIDKVSRDYANDRSKPTLK
jgi:hypothetical protein